MNVHYVADKLHNNVDEDPENKNTKQIRIENASDNNSEPPLKLLLIKGAVSALVGKSGCNVNEIQVSSGASIVIQRDNDVPIGFNERIVTILGTMEQKSLALDLIIDKLKPSIVNPSGDIKDAITMVIPQRAVSMLIGTKGSKIQELSKKSNCDIQINNECLGNPAERCVDVCSDSCSDIISGIMIVHKFLEVLYNTGKLLDQDFQSSINYLAISQNMITPIMSDPIPIGNMLHRPIANQHSSSVIKLVINAESAAWIVGKNGAHIRDIKMNSGADFQISEPTYEKCFSVNDRILAISGSLVSKYIAMKIIIPAMESKAWNIDKPLKFLLPSRVVSLIIGSKGVTVKQLTKMSNATFQVEQTDCPYNERILSVKGNNDAKTVASIAILQKFVEFERPELAKDNLFLSHLDVPPMGGIYMEPIIPAPQFGYCDMITPESHFYSQAPRYTTPHVISSRQQYIVEIVLPRMQVDIMLHMEKMGSSPFADIANRSGCQVRLGLEMNNGASRSVLLTGTPMANSLGLLILQERLIDAWKK